MRILHAPIFLKKNSRRQYIFELCIVFIFLCGFILQLSSCSEDVIDKKEIPDVNPKFKDGNINFEIKFETYGADDMVSTRSAADLGSETVVIPLDDDLSMYATLQNAPKEVTTRSAMLRSFASNAELHIVAYELGALIPVYDKYAVYSVDDAVFNPTITRISPTPITLDIGKMYRLVAFSRNNDTPIPLIYPPVAPLGCNPDDSDLLWGVCDSIDITGPGSYDVTIYMKHLFSQVTVQASSSIGDFTGTRISGVEMPGYTANMHVDSGRMEPNISINQAFTGFTPTTPTTMTSLSRLVYTGGDNSTIIKVNSVEIEGITHPVPIPAIFSKQLKSGHKYDMEIKIGKSHVVTDDPPPPGFMPYVGAFWKATQMGERLIRIPRTSTGNADGTWSAAVIEGEDWIMLDKNWTNDPDIYGTNPHTYENYGLFETNHKLDPSSASNTVTGTLRAGNAEEYQPNDEYIRFRIGLKSAYTPTSAAPARYGVVLLTYHNNNLRQRLFIRQGEEPDFVMKPGELDGAGGSVSDNRTKARKFSPYNLSAATLNAVVDTSGASIVVNPGIPTAYPSQAGALFQWAGAGATKRFGYDAYSSLALESSVEAGFWSLLSYSQETCPAGYRRPDDGPEDIFYSAGDVGDSELRQSLFLDPVSSSGISSTSNSVYGYYADGFFDRMAISNNSVASGTSNIAHIGRLFYNPDSRASLFFPNSGYRNAGNSNMQDMGIRSSYWTGTMLDNDYAWSMSLDASDASFKNTLKKSTASSIRCVLATLSATPRGVWLSPSPGNSTKVIIVNSTDPWVVESTVTNASLSVLGGSGPTYLTVTRSTTVFGRQTLVLRNQLTDELTYVSIDNYYIDDSDDLELPNNLLTGNTRDFEIFVDGGSETFTIVSQEDSWFTASIVGGKLRLTADQSPNMEPRSSTITLAHADDPTYQVTFVVDQDLYTPIPPFDYFVLKFTWEANDVDIAVEFAGNDLMDNGQPIPFDNDQYYEVVDQGSYRALGYSMSGLIGPNGGRKSSPSSTGHLVADLKDSLIFWGGDATAGQGETVFFNAPLLTPLSRKLDVSGLPRKLKLEVYVHWWTSINVNKPVRLRIMTYTGGVMKHCTDDSYAPDIRDKNFYNVDDYTTPLIPGNIHPPIFDINRVNIIDKNASAYISTFRTRFTHVCSIIYDRYTRSATISWHATEYTGTVDFNSMEVPMSPLLPITQEEVDRTAAEKDALLRSYMQKLR